LHYAWKVPLVPPSAKPRSSKVGLLQVVTEP
jgi:hypothetical protein